MGSRSIIRLAPVLSAFTVVFLLSATGWSADDRARRTVTTTPRAVQQQMRQKVQAGPIKPIEKPKPKLDMTKPPRGTIWEELKRRASRAIIYLKPKIYSYIPHTCGNGEIEGPEECDDGNTVNGDGCSCSCYNEPAPVENCGNGICEAGEVDHVVVNNDGDTAPRCCQDCLNYQECGDGHMTLPPAPPHTIRCGNCMLDGAGEECDDGNRINNDGCSNSCRRNPGCGDGVIEGSEQCDDGNTNDGDGCSSDCISEGLCVQADVMTVLDRSESIGELNLSGMVGAIRAFTAALDPSVDGVHMGQVTFSDSATLDLHLTGDRLAIDRASGLRIVYGSTNLYEGIFLADGELGGGDGHDRDDLTAPDFMLIITDGEPNEGGGLSGAAEAATAAKAAGVTIYALGVNVSPGAADWLRNEIATSPAHYSDVGDWSELEQSIEDLTNCGRREGP